MLIVIIGIILSVGYVLWFYCCVVFGELMKDVLWGFSDVNLCEIIIFVLFVVVMFYMGFYLLFVFDFIDVFV